MARPTAEEDCLEKNSSFLTLGEVEDARYFSSCKDEAFRPPPSARAPVVESPQPFLLYPIPTPDSYCGRLHASGDPNSFLQQSVNPRPSWLLVRQSPPESLYSTPAMTLNADKFPVLTALHQASNLQTAAAPHQSITVDPPGGYNQRRFGEEDTSDAESEFDLRQQESYDIKQNREYYDPLSAMYDSEISRVWHVDWMRFVANWLVVSVHFVRTAKEMHLPASIGQQVTLDAFLVNLLQIGMPIFFYASGRASGFSNDRSFLLYLRKKCLRLLVPLAAAYFTVLLPAALISGPFYESRDDTMPDSTWGNVGESIKWWLKRFPLGTVGWLWYLPVLAGLGVVTYPYCLWINTWHLCCTPSRLLTRRDKAAKTKLLEETYRVSIPDHLPYSQKLFSRPVRDLTLWLCLAGILATLTCNFIYRDYRMQGSLMAVYSLGFLLPPFLFMAMLPLCRRWNWRTPFFAVFPIVTIIFAFIKETTFSDFRIQGLTSNTWAAIISVPYYVAFYLQGHLEQRFMYEWEHYERMAIRSSSGKVTTSFVLRPFKVILWVALWANGAPGFRDEFGYMWAYPLYNKTYTTVSYVVASWIGLHFWERFMAFYARTNISAIYHKHVINMSLIVYIFHGLHIAIVGRIMIWPFRDRIVALAGVIIFVITVVPLTILTYFFVINVPPLATCFGVGSGFKSWKFANWGQPGRDFLRWVQKRSGPRTDNDITTQAQREAMLTGNVTPTGDATPATQLPGPRAS
eukprot:Gregarina_sp_Poly_1__5500@NODE_28_length_19636_cov_263_287087_g25_i0_p2_GENE_NODE_28_length_19636_cov_263_287087_g25_i0NODE_28_length_19636_cov_263_287087_g25_i0_p2_ORF_typecomplete_len743_score81_61Acyl_transf_3/PF01757_22/3_9e08_NODE_28_length_19636_cov_263_287087_g25_i076959923